MSAEKFEAGERITGTYFVGVYKPEIGGWRQEQVDAVLEVVTPGKARVISAAMEQAGSRRQRYNVTGVENGQAGAVKIISRLSDVKRCE